MALNPSHLQESIPSLELSLMVYVFRVRISTSVNNGAQRRPSAGGHSISQIVIFYAVRVRICDLRNNRAQSRTLLQEGIPSLKFSFFYAVRVRISTSEIMGPKAVPSAGGHSIPQIVIFYAVRVRISTSEIIGAQSRHPMQEGIQSLKFSFSMLSV